MAAIHFSGGGVRNMYRKKKLISSVILVLFFLSTVYAPAFAEDRTLAESVDSPSYSVDVETEDALLETETTTEQAIQLATPTTVAQASSGSCGDNTTWEYADGMLVIRGTGTVTSSPGWQQRERITTVIVEEGVTGFDDGVFAGYTGLTKVTLPESLTTIGIAAFSSCSALEEIVIPEGIDNIANNAFYDCTALRAVHLPERVTAIGEYAFEGCTALQELTLPSGVTTIGRAAFSDCTSLTKLEIPSGIVSIGKSAFAGSGITAAVIPTGLTAIGETWFYGCKDLASVFIPPTIESIDEYAFRYCDKLAIYGVAGSYAETFASQNNIPFSVYEFGNSGTVVQIIQERLVLPAENTMEVSAEILSSADGVPHTISWTVEDSSILQIVTSENNLVAGSSTAQVRGLRAGITKLIATTDDGATTSREIEVASNRGDCGGTWSLVDGILTVTGPGKIAERPWESFSDSIQKIIVQDGITEICDWAFSDCKNVTEASLGEGLLTIGAGAFSKCTALKTISLPDSLTTISGTDLYRPLEGAFYGCSALQQIAIPENVIEIGPTAFEGCSALEEFRFPKNFCLNGQTYLNAGMFRDCTSLKKVVLPEGVTCLGGFFLSGCSALTEINLPNSLLFINEAAFMDCASLPEIAIPDTIEKIGASAFGGCSSLTSITIPNGIKTLDDFCNNCTQLQTVSLPAGLTRISGFRNCSALEAIEIPESVTVIFGFNQCENLKYISFPKGLEQLSGFSKCTSLEEIIVPDNVTYLNAFSGCTALKRIVLPDNLTEIPMRAFDECSALTTITIPANVTKIGSSAFERCYRLKTIHFCGDAPEMGSNSIMSWVQPTIYYPAGNGTWTAEKIQEYKNILADTAGEITWQPYNVEAAVTKISLSQSTATLKPGETLQLTANITPTTATNKAVNWESSDPTIGVVDGNGLVTAKNTGAATITATSVDGGYVATCQLVVSTMEPVQEGTWFDSVHWNYDPNTGVLRIRGTGTITGYADNLILPDGFNKAKTIIIEEGITGIGQRCFGANECLETVVLPKSVKQIGYEAFPAKINYLIYSENNPVVQDYAQDHHIPYYEGNQLLQPVIADLYIWNCNVEDTEKTASAVRQELVEKNMQNDLATAMETDQLALQVTASLEGHYKVEKNIGDVNVVVDAVTQQAGVSEQIEIVGAALNAEDEGATVTLSLAETTETPNLDERSYKNVIVTDMDLTGIKPNTDGSLQVPVHITMPVPETMENPQNFVILHYGENGTDYEKIEPILEVQDGMYFASFSLTHFSTFVFAERAYQKGDVNEDGNITAADMQRIYAHMNGSNPLTGALLQAADTNGDGVITAADMQRIYAHMNGSNPFN